MPEFGNWMIEAVPAVPYGAYADPAELLSCHDKISLRRKHLQEFLSKHGDGKTKIASTAIPIVLGTPNSMTSNDPELRAKIYKAYEQGVRQTNPCTQSDLIPEFTANPHPRFLGLA